MQDIDSKLSELGKAIAEKRDEAISARKESGIEDVWMSCEEAYLGIDDTNRGDFAKAKWAKPSSMEGPVTSNYSKQSEVRSNAYVRLTSRYVDAGAAKLGEILLPIDDKPFSLDATPVQDAEINNYSPATDESGTPIIKQNPDGTQAQVTVGDLAKQRQDKAHDAAKKAELRIQDWLIEAKFQQHMRNVIHDAARIGVGVIKAPFPDARHYQKMSANGDTSVLEIVKEVVPSAKWVDPWNVFPEPSCGENIHHGDYILERDFLSQRMLKKLIGQEGYISSQIEKVIQEGPGKINEDGKSPHQQKTDGRYEVWYFYGSMHIDDLATANPKEAGIIAEDVEDVFVIATLINDSVIRVIVNPLDSGQFPYKAMPWTRRAGSWAGVGVGEQCSMPQRMCNAGTRAMINNAGKSAGSQIVIDQSGITPADGSWTITPDKLWFKTPDAGIDDVRKAFMAVTFPNMQPQLMAIVEYAFRLAEEATNIPLISQGQTGPTTPETLGATQIQNNNANILLRSVGYSFDDHITEPVIRGFYEWLMLDPSVPDEEKGDFKINAHGSSALVERAIQDNMLQQMGGMVMNPAFRIDPAKWFEQLLKSKRLDPRSVQYTEEEFTEIQKSQQPQPPVQIAVAQIKAQADQAKTQATLQAEAQIAQIENETARTRIQVDTDRDTALVNAQHEKNMVEAQARMAELQLKKELAMMEYASTHQLSLDEIKASLAKESMRLNVQRELSGATLALDAHKHYAPQVANPAVEPYGRAPNGQAFAQ